MQERIYSLSLEHIAMTMVIHLAYLRAKIYFIIFSKILFSALYISVARAFTLLSWTEIELFFEKCCMFHCHYSHRSPTTYHIIYLKQKVPLNSENK